VPAHPDASADAGGTSSYNLRQPDLEEARAAIHQLYGADGPRMWNTLTTGAGLTGDETDLASLDRLLTAMFAHDPVTALCARAIQIRVDTHRRLTTVHALIRAAE
jgi:hypothetical protein